MKKIYTTSYLSPCGEMLLGEFEGKLCLCEWLSGKSNESIHRRLCRLLNAQFVDAPAGRSMGSEFVDAPAGRSRSSEMTELAAAMNDRYSETDEVNHIGKGSEPASSSCCDVESGGYSGVIEKAALQLDEYFNGTRRSFDIPLLFVGTEFQKRVWNELLTIPYATPLSYGELARRIGMPSAVRAVANANGANAISIFVPCHRIIGTDRSLTGYGGGLPAKRHLLDVEGIAYREQ